MPMSAPSLIKFLAAPFWQNIYHLQGVLNVNSEGLKFYLKKRSSKMKLCGSKVLIYILRYCLWFVMIKIQYSL